MAARFFKIDERNLEADDMAEAAAAEVEGRGGMRGAIVAAEAAAEAAAGTDEVSSKSSNVGEGLIDGSSCCMESGMDGG
jgi:hypothetical protein